jgi:ketosteroid isomerase-like protein
VKKHFIPTSIALLILLAPAGRAASQGITSTDSTMVKRTIEQAIGWAIEKDFDATFRLWADNLFIFWVFSNDMVVGIDSYKTFAEQWRNPDFRGTRCEFKNLRIVFSRSGDVVWYSSFVDDCSSFKGKESCMENVFVTGVLKKKDGRWVHTLTHASYPVDKIPEIYARKFYSNLFKN